MNHVILRKRDIERIVGLTERTVRIMEAQGKFPRRFVLNPGGRAVGWRSTEVQEWIEARARSRGVETGTMPDGASR